jgi:branched-chain amino acid transport system ATP-binding protein
MTRPGAPAAAGAAPLLSVQGLEGWYGESHVLHSITRESFDTVA